jgi:hypothetical protein
LFSLGRRSNFLVEKTYVPFFFDLSSLLPTVERNPFEPVVVHDEVESELGYEEETAVVADEPVEDRGLPIPASYDLDLMRALVQDPFHLFVHWQLKDDPFERLRRIFPVGEADNFHTVLKLIDETNRIAVYFDAAFTREYWFDVFPDRRYRVELGMRSPRFGYIKLLGSQAVQTPRGAPSEQMAPEEEYQVTADDYLRVLRDSHLVPERAFTPEGLLPQPPGVSRAEVWASLPDSFKQVFAAIAAMQAGRDYERFWERLSEEELAEWMREFLQLINRMGGGELGYMLLLRYLPELLRRAIKAESGAEAGPAGDWEIDKPIVLYLAEKLGQTASEQNVGNAPTEVEQPESQPWLPSLNL